MPKVALLFGSFSPVHNGHLALAEYAVRAQKVQEVWFVISPHNPLKSPSELLPLPIRLDLLKEAVSGLKLEQISVCDVETRRPGPHYTYQTLQALRAEAPMHEFSPLIGTDILQELHLWKQVDRITEEFGWLIYPRPGYLLPDHHPAQARMQFWEEAPQSTLSSSQLRADWCAGRSTDYGMPEAVFEQWKQRVSTQLKPLESAEDWYEEGVRQRRWNRFGEAANCFAMALQLNPEHQKARVATEMLQSIQAFYHSDIYNP